MISSFSKSLIYIFAISLGLLLMIVSLGHTAPHDLHPFLNSDSMFFHAMYNDLFIEGSCLWGWDLNTTFNLMPNAILYFISLTIINHPVGSQVVHGLLQYSLFLWAAWYLLQSLRPKPSAPLTAVVMLLPAWLFINSMLHDSYFISAQLFHPYHFGSLIMTCIVAGLNLRLMYRSSSKTTYIWIFILGALAAFSNRIFILMFTIPWLTSLLIMWLLKIQAFADIKRNAVINALAAFGGFSLFLVIRKLPGLSFHPTHMFSWNNVLPSFENLGKTYMDFITKEPVLGFLILLGLMTFFVMLVKLVLHLRKNDSTYLRQDARIPVYHFILISLLLVPAVFLAPAILGMFFSMASARYNFLVIIWLILCLAPILQIMWNKKPWKIIQHIRFYYFVLILTAVAGFLAVINRNPVKGLEELFGYYPQVAQCIDKAANEYNLKNGISGFWDAKPASAFSKKEIKVRQVYNTLRPYILGVNQNWYYPYCQETEPPVFNFIINGPDLDQQAIHDFFGQRIDTIIHENCMILKVPDFIFDKQWEEKIIILEE